MSIRKTGAATGQVISVEPHELTTTAAARVPLDVVSGSWEPGDETCLAAENQAADQGGE